MLALIYPLLTTGLCTVKGFMVNDRISATFLLAVISPVQTTLGLCIVRGFKVNDRILATFGDISIPNHIRNVQRL
jgi:hypothetical protein